MAETFLVANWDVYSGLLLFHALQERIMKIYKMWGFHGGEDSYHSLLGYDVV
jgi:hypothetical protein